MDDVSIFRAHGSRLLLAAALIAAALLCALWAPGAARAAAGVDVEAPRAAVGGLVTPAAGAVAVVVRAGDAGAGLAGVSLLVDGVEAAARAWCAAAPCPEEADAELVLDTTAYADGAHRVSIVVRDAAGNATVAADQVVVVRNAPVVVTSSIVVGVGSGDGGGGAGGGGGTTGGGTTGGASTGGASSGGGSATGGGADGAVACARPQLSVLLAQKPLRVVKGRVVLKRGVRYRFAGRLTCLRAGRRVSAARGTKIELVNIVGRRTLAKSGTTVRAGGRITMLLAYASSRVLEFRYRSGDGDGGTARVRIPVTVARR